MGRPAKSDLGPRSATVRLRVPPAVAKALKMRHGARGVNDALNALLEQEYAAEIEVIEATS